MRFTNKRTFKNYITRLINEEARKLREEEDFSTDLDLDMDMDMDMERETSKKSGMSKSDYSGYGNGKSSGKTSSEVVEEAFIPVKFFSSRLNESSSRSQVKISKAFRMLREGRISKARFFNIVGSITNTATRNTYVTTPRGNVSIRSFVNRI